MNELNVIKELEEILKIKLQSLENFTFDSKGYIIDEKSNVIGLALQDCKIENLNSIANQLKNLPHLTVIDLSQNPLIDLSLLEQISNLKSLTCSSTKISDFSIFSKLTNLNDLDISLTGLQDLSYLGALKGLTRLSATNNGIEDISPLKKVRGPICSKFKQ